ncbi:hypothetical protein GMJLKIPL_0926 [Methylobacterium isbiliense]|uniref:Uncharacterized protein n=1 Tax=Methylobacterium isbiliense TaxID=315478 RepID=A0ABQ4S930_9HYPH|nr:hypothetical protein GMJLKIPL_0926 [Methylobacterium isbiliense]
MDRIAISTVGSFVQSMVIVTRTWPVVLGKVLPFVAVLSGLGARRDVRFQWKGQRALPAEAV